LTFVAADFSVTALEKGRRHAWKETGPSPCWSATDLQALAFRNATFDTVISCESIEHIERPRQACEEFARVLRVGGRLYLTTPNYMGPLGLYRGYRRLVNRPFTEEGQPINRFMLLPILCWWLRRAGFRLLTVAGTGHYLPWPGRPPIALTQLDSRVLFRWLALHSLVVAERA
jgi:SAM-dependent methyltransferase